jgi:hypothetical protein
MQRVGGNEMKLFLTIICVLILSHGAIGVEISPLSDMYIECFNDQLEITKTDYLTGESIVIDSLPLPNMRYLRGIEWSLYDPINNRIFYQETNIPSPPIYLHVYDLKTKKYFDLPYKNFFGDHAEMLISPQSKYIIMSCLGDSTSKRRLRDYSEAALKELKSKLVTYVLDGSSLDLIATRAEFGIYAASPQYSFVSPDNKYLINDEYSRTDSIGWGVIYSLPGLTPIDTINTTIIGWNGDKYIRDVSADYLLLKGKKADSSNGLAPGDYVFVVDYKTKNIISPFIISTGALFSPDGSELVSYSPERNSIIRYSPTTGEIIGETALPEGTIPFKMTFRADNKLYIKDKNNYSTTIVVDYKNDRVDKTIQFKQK